MNPIVGGGGLGIYAELGYQNAAPAPAQPIYVEQSSSPNTYMHSTIQPESSLAIWGEAFGVQAEMSEIFPAALDMSESQVLAEGAAGVYGSTTHDHTLSGLVSGEMFGYANPQGMVNGSSLRPRSDLYSYESQRTALSILPYRDFAASLGSVPLPILGGDVTSAEPVNPSDEFEVDGRVYGCGTNIFSLYADPETSSNWEKYNLQNAALVVACMPDRLESCDALCEYLKDTQVPVMIVCTSNQNAKQLYDSGASYVVQEDYLGSKEMTEMLVLEIQNILRQGPIEDYSDNEAPRDPRDQHVHHAHNQPHAAHTGQDATAGDKHSADAHGDASHHGGPFADLFKLRALDHKEELLEEESDLVRNKIGMFM